MDLVAMLTRYVWVDRCLAKRLLTDHFDVCGKVQN